MRAVHLIAALAAMVPAFAGAAETVTYSYDAKGRLTQFARSGSVNNAITATYQFDKADNRTAVSVTGSPFNEPPRPVLVLPLAGLPVIALPTL